MEGEKSKKQGFRAERDREVDEKHCQSDTVDPNFTISRQVSNFGFQKSFFDHHFPIYSQTKNARVQNSLYPGYKKLQNGNNTGLHAVVRFSL